VAARQGGHDVRLLDALDELDRIPFTGPCWRVVRQGRDPLDGSRGAGRWNPAQLSVLYTSLEADGALAEIHFHLSRGQPVFPSRIRHDLCELSASTDATLDLADMDDLVALGVERERYRDLLTTRTQEIGAAAAFLGFDGLISPSARYECRNLVLFLDNCDLGKVRVVSSGAVDWKAWRSAPA